MTCSTTPTIEPNQFTQGERVEWTRYFCDYSPTLYTAKWVFRGPSTGFTITGTADGSSFNAVISAAITAAITPGKWQWWASVTEIANALNIIAVGDGVTQVRQGAPTSTAILDTRTPNEIILATLDAAIAGSVSSTVMEYEISTPAGSRRVKHMTRKELTDLRSYYATLVARDNQKRRTQNGGPFFKQVKVVMRDD